MFTVFVIPKLDIAPGTGIRVAELLPDVGSPVVLVTVAVLVYVPEPKIVAVMVIVAVAPLAKLPIVQFGLVQLPVDVAALI